MLRGTPNLWHYLSGLAALIRIDRSKLQRTSLPPEMKTKTEYSRPIRLVDSENALFQSERL
jgi:hypothetical protein